jgi:phosphoserine aminotransferase
MNLLRDKSRVAYIETGMWSEKAIKAAKQYGEVSIVASSKANNYTTAPDLTDLPLDDSYAYLHYTPNETIHGVRIFDIPGSLGIPLIADMSSMILSEPIDVSRFGLIYAGAQKNIGPAGVTIVIVRKDLCGGAMPTTPDVLDYAKQAADGSMLNTPPCFAWYMAGLVFEWIEAEGGVEAMHARAKERAATLYEAIDRSKLYQSPIALPNRSLMNIPFLLKDPTLDKQFLTEAEATGLLSLAGHRSVGGMRASLYNAMPQEGVETLVSFMRTFEENHPT